eukprot:157875-Pyramimonas_sp.AAC.1
MASRPPVAGGQANGAGNEEDGDMMTRRGSLVALKGSIKDAYSMKDCARSGGGGGAGGGGGPL